MAGKKSGSTKGGGGGKGLDRKAVRRFVRTRGPSFLKDPNVTSIGVGYKNGDPAQGECLVFSVGAKAEGAAALEALDTRELPKTITIDGVEVPTDVIQRKFEPSYEVVETEALNPRKIRANPVRPGISVSHKDGSAGTIGLIVYDDESGAPCILSNWHVLHGAAGEVGDNIVQPGPHDDNNILGNFCGDLMRSHLGPAGDCALARVRGRQIDRKVFELDVVPSRLAEVDLGDTVIKSGRTTAITRGVVRRIDVIARIDYGAPGMKEIGCFEIGVDPEFKPDNGEVSMGGDSGAAWLISENGEATDIFAGLHFAGETRDSTDEHALACYPISIQRKLGFSIAPPAAPTAVEGAEEGGVPRSGYDPRFLGVDAPIPEMSLGIKRDAVNFGRAQTIPYTHFSVCLSAKRRLPRFVAWNIDGARRVILGRHDFRIDDRIDPAHQWDNSLYKNNKLDRGHIARRADLAWGPVPEARQANLDSFFFTNIAPQHERFNQSSKSGLWGELENMVLEQADAQDIRLSVIGGPLFRDDDPSYRGARIPREYWKLLAYRAADGMLTSSAFVLSQMDMLHDLEALDLDPFRLFQVSIDDLEQRTGLGFAAYRSSDVVAHPERAASVREVARQIESVDAAVREIVSADQISF